MYQINLHLRYAPSQSGDDLDQLEKGLLPSNDGATGRDNAEKEVQLGSAESSPDSTPEKSGGPLGNLYADILYECSQ